VSKAPRYRHCCPEIPDRAAAGAAKISMVHEVKVGSKRAGVG